MSGPRWVITSVQKLREAKTNKHKQTKLGGSAISVGVIDSSPPPPPVLLRPPSHSTSSSLSHSLSDTLVLALGLAAPT